MNPQNLTPMNLLSQQVAYHPRLFVEEISNMGNSSVMKPVTMEPKGSQMTIFYAGQVMVFDDLPADKAKEIMSFASKKTSENQNNNYASTFLQRHPSFPARSSPSFITRPFPFHLNIIPTTPNNSVQEHPQQSSTPVVYDLPMTRKASLHRFLEKRKDRIASRSPYQTSNPMAAFSKQADESISWLGLAQQDKSESSSSSVLF
ncbi:Tify domain [Sesbania bispinosa]|nr:Tify domain [Sesbania bispinosa]